MFELHLKKLTIKQLCVTTLDYIPKNDLNYLQSKVILLMLPFPISLRLKLLILVKFFFRFHSSN